MNLPHFLTVWLDSLSSLTLANTGLTWFDFIVFLVFLLYGVSGFSTGFIESFIELTSFALSFTLGLKLYSHIGKLLISLFSFSPTFSNAIGFFIVAIFFEILFKFLLKKLFPRFSEVSHLKELETLVFINRILGFFSGLASAFILLSFLFSILVSLPISLFLSRSISSSFTGKFLIARTQNFEKNLRDIFGGSLYETVNFFTVAPLGDDFVTLHFKTDSGTIDTASETHMLDLVNTERKKAGLPPYVSSTELVDVAREHSKDMLERGYFSHHTPEGSGSVDRMLGVRFAIAGENLALAPSTDSAMRGLMNSPGHRVNILSSKFRKIGIGAIDGGVYGIMYTQEFTD